MRGFSLILALPKHANQHSLGFVHPKLSCCESVPTGYGGYKQRICAATQPRARGRPVVQAFVIHSALGGALAYDDRPCCRHVLHAR